MHTKFVIFLAISTVFVAAIYSSSVSVVFGATTSCYNTDKTHSSCTVSETDAAGKLTQTFWDCTYHKSTKTWSCVEASAPPPPPGISDAIVKAQSHLSAAGAATEGGNTGGSNNTSVLQGKVLKHGGALKGGETDNNASTNSSDPLQ